MVTLHSKKILTKTDPQPDFIWIISKFDVSSSLSPQNLGNPEQEGQKDCRTQRLWRTSGECSTFSQLSSAQMDSQGLMYQPWCLQMSGPDSLCRCCGFQVACFVELLTVEAGACLSYLWSLGTLCSNCDSLSSLCVRAFNLFSCILLCGLRLFSTASLLLSEGAQMESRSRIKEGSQEVGENEGGKTLVGMCCVREESFFLINL